ncbi:LOW QUALITY PROTEIN: SmHox8 (fragment) [Schistosoma mansoni]|uniref:SmHox8 (fragment) n=1 Tax=Schistosoma mansoni TaxID=6183 RepID=UPI00022C8281
MFPMDNRLGLNSAFDNLFPRSLSSCITNPSHVDTFRSEWNSNNNNNNSNTSTQNAQPNNNNGNSLQLTNNPQLHSNTQLNLRQPSLSTCNNNEQFGIVTMRKPGKPVYIASANSLTDTNQTNSQIYQNPGFSNTFTGSMNITSSNKSNNIHNINSNDNHNNDNNVYNMKMNSFRSRSEYNHFDIGSNTSHPIDLFSNSTHFPLPGTNMSNNTTISNTINSSNNQLGPSNSLHLISSAHNNNNANVESPYNKSNQPCEIGAFHPLVSNYSPINLLNSSIRYPLRHSTSDITNAGSQRIDTSNPFLDFHNPNSTSLTNTSMVNSEINNTVNSLDNQTIDSHFKSNYKHFTNKTAAAAVAMETASVGGMNIAGYNNASLNITSPEMIRHMGQNMTVTSSNNAAVAVAAIAAAAAATNYMVANTGMSNFGVSSHLNLSGHSRESGIDGSDMISPSSTPCERLNKQNNNNNHQMENSVNIGNHLNSSGSNNSVRSSLSPTHIWPWMTVVGKLFNQFIT